MLTLTFLNWSNDSNKRGVRDAWMEKIHYYYNNNDCSKYTTPHIHTHVWTNTNLTSYLWRYTTGTHFLIYIQNIGLVRCCDNEHCLFFEAPMQKKTDSVFTFRKQVIPILMHISKCAKLSRSKLRFNLQYSAKICMLYDVF